MAGTGDGVILSEHQHIGRLDKTIRYRKTKINIFTSTTQFQKGLQ